MNNINLRKNVNSKGITLVALVIIIVILLILATVSVGFLTGKDGLISRAKIAIENKREVQKEEKIKLAVGAAQIAGKGTITTENLQNELRVNFKDNGIIIEKIEDRWYYDEYYVDEKGEVGRIEQLLPKGYRQVEYVESSGEQYFILDKLSTKDFGFDIDLYIVKDTGANVFGGYKDKGHIYSYCYMGTRNSLLSYFPNLNHVEFTPIDYENKHNYKFIKSNALQYNYYYDGNLVGTTNLQNNVDCVLAVFTFIDSNGVPRTSNIETFKGRIYKFIIYDGDVEICNLVPCIRAEDKKIGMYDTVSRKFYTNQSGVGDFKAGSNV